MAQVDVVIVVKIAVEAVVVVVEEEEEEEEIVSSIARTETQWDRVMEMQTAQAQHTPTLVVKSGSKEWRLMNVLSSRGGKKYTELRN